MPNGFSGRPAQRFFTMAGEAHTFAQNRLRRAPQIHEQTQSPQRLASARVNIEQGIQARERQLPFTPDDANSGRFTTGRGDSNNIVVIHGEYEAISHSADRIDEAIGECIYRVACEIEEMCQTIFIMPSVVRGCMNIADSVKGSLSQFRSLTFDTLLQARVFAQEIMDIGH